MSAINWSNITSPGDFPAIANHATSGMFWPASVFMLWIILILVLIVFGLEVALLAATFAALIIALLLTYAGLVAFYVPLFFMAMLLILFLYITYSQKRQ